MSDYRADEHTLHNRVHHQLHHNLLSLAIAQALLLGAAGTQAATITVTSSLDDGTACTLREAIANAENDTDNGVNGCVAGSGADTIVFDNTLSGSTITLGSTLTIQTDVKIDGDINNDNSPDITVSGNNSTRVFNVKNASLFVRNANATFEGLTITGGIAGTGAGIRATYYSTVNIVNSTISGNVSTSAGGGIDCYTCNSVSINNSTITANTATQGGAARFYDAVITITDSTISGNTATVGTGGAMYVGGFVKPITVTRSTISGNSSAASGGGIYAYGKPVIVSNSSITGNSAMLEGGGVVVYGGSLSLSNSTVSNNMSGTKGAGVSARYYASISLTNSTVSGNSAVSNGGGLYLTRSTANITNSTISDNIASTVGVGLYSMTTTLTLQNSIIANSTGGADCFYTGGMFNNGIVGAVNLIEDGSCDMTAIMADPMLGVLADNGGNTPTHLPQTGSAVIDVGDNTICGTGKTIDVDQRGNARSDGSCDIGSVEVASSNNNTSNVSSGSFGGSTSPLTLLLGLLLWPLRRLLRH